jgi:hypothetical protein
VKVKEKRYCDSAVVRRVERRACVPLVCDWPVCCVLPVACAFVTFLFQVLTFCCPGFRLCWVQRCRGSFRFRAAS